MGIRESSTTCFIGIELELTEVLWRELPTFSSMATGKLAMKDPAPE
jgi:hypothetical protein